MRIFGMILSGVLLAGCAATSVPDSAESILIDDNASVFDGTKEETARSLLEYLAGKTGAHGRASRQGLLSGMRSYCGLEWEAAMHEFETSIPDGVGIEVIREDHALYFQKALTILQDDGEPCSERLIDDIRYTD